MTRLNRTQVITATAGVVALWLAVPAAGAAPSGATVHAADTVSITAPASVRPGRRFVVVARATVAGFLTTASVRRGDIEVRLRLGKTCPKTPAGRLIASSASSGPGTFAAGGQPVITRPGTYVLCGYAGYNLTTSARTTRRIVVKGGKVRTAAIAIPAPGSYSGSAGGVGVRFTVKAGSGSSRRIDRIEVSGLSARICDPSPGVTPVPLTPAWGADTDDGGIAGVDGQVRGSIVRSLDPNEPPPLSIEHAGISGGATSATRMQITVSAASNDETCAGAFAVRASRTGS